MTETPEDFNPYAAPTSDLMPESMETQAVSGAVGTRYRYLSRESDIRSMGLLIYLGSAFLSFGMVALLAGGLRDGRMLKMSIGFAYLLGLSITIGWGLRALKEWARVSSIVILLMLLIIVVPALMFESAASWIALGALVFVLLLTGFVFYILLSRDSRYVFTREYRLVIDATPTLRHETSVGVKIFFVVAIVDLLIALTLVMSG